MPKLDDPDAVKRRQLLYTKFALGVAQQDRERKKLQAIQEDSKNVDSKTKVYPTQQSWLCGNQQSEYDADQFAYVEEYKRAFEKDFGSDQPPDTNDENTEAESTQMANSPSIIRAQRLANPSKYYPKPASRDTSPTRSTISNNSDNDAAAAKSVRSSVRGSGMPKLRGRGAAFAAKSSICEFDVTSTAMAPTVVQKNFDNDYTSNVNIGELQKAFFSNYKSNSSLPIYQYRQHLITCINAYNVVIIEGNTGCGKTTQVPMYILEDAILNNPHTERPSPVIYVTQPRKIAARSIAKRICDEHNWELGSVVGYQVGLDKCTTPQTVLTFCTSGVLLQKLIQDKSLTNYSHIIIDEAHERDADTDLLMMMIRTLMRKEKSFFRLIIMSATMDIGKLKSYFTCQLPFSHGGISKPSVCKVGTIKPLETRIIYYDGLKPFVGTEEVAVDFQHDEPMIHDSCYNAAVKLILEVIPKLDTFGEDSKSTLVFLPGLAEITKLHRMLLSTGCPEFISIIPLHSCISSEDQSKVFEMTRTGYRKVILATNIAESSITVKDVGFIVDFCLTRTLVKDQVTKFPTLRINWSTKDKCVQRAGRTGRCCKGKVFRLVNQAFFQEFPEYAQPELLTVPLELSVLRVKNFQMGELKALFALVLDPPPLQEIRTAVLELKQIGGLTSTYEGKTTDLDGDLTDLGRIISILPIDVHLSKLIVIGAVLDILDDAIIIAACLSTNRTVVKHIYNNTFETYVNKLNHSRGSFSDLFVNLDVYRDYEYYKDKQQKDARWLDEYCSSRLLDERKLHEVSCLVLELTNRLEQINIKTMVRPNSLEVVNQVENELMLKIAFCAAFYPNYFLSHELDVDDVRRSLCGLDPTKVVIVGNIPLNQCPLYCDQILSQLESKISKNIDYITDNSRAVLVIKDEDKLTNVNDAAQLLGDSVIQNSRAIDRRVYLAVKYSESDRIVVREYRDDAAFERMNYYRDQVKLVPLGHRLPPPWTKIVRGRRADNTRLINASDREYSMIDEEFFIEVEYNEKQNSLDLSELDRLEQSEDERLISERMSNVNTTVNDMKQQAVDPEHPIYKKCYRRLNGPRSPIQMKFRSILEKSKDYIVEIDGNSVNSILLDPEYEQKRSQMLIAASVGQTRGNKVVVRDTTLMPNIRGLVNLMALLFSQYYRLVTDEETGQWTGATFGLGWDQDGKPIHRDYEVDMDFDVAISKEDIELINHGRKLLSELIRSLDMVQNPGAPRAQQQKTLRNIILTLIRTKRS